MLVLGVAFQSPALHNISVEQAENLGSNVDIAVQAALRRRRAQALSIETPDRGRQTEPSMRSATPTRRTQGFGAP
jgi:hypothetical protein